jgi:membrane protein DedA with SNARE-associated domain
VETALVDTVAWIEPHAVWLVMVLPPLIRVVGHWIPEELFMLSVGILAARSDDHVATGVVIAALLASQFITDQATFAVGRFFGPRLQRFQRLSDRLHLVTDRLERSPLAVLGLVPARVFPLCRGAWLVGCGLTGIRWRTFASVNVLALLTHLTVWAGLGWWFADDLVAITRSASQLKVIGVTGAISLAAVFTLVAAWHQRRRWQSGLVRVLDAGRDVRFGPHR